MQEKSPRSTQLDSILEAVDAAIVTIDSRGIVIDCNAATSRMFGYSRTELVNQNVSVMMPDPYHSEHDQYISNHLKSGENRIIGKGRKVRGRHQSGHIFPVHLSVAKYQENGETFFSGILHDLSELDEAHSVGSRLGMIVEESVNEVYSFNYNTLQVTSANRAAHSNLGYSKQQLLSKTLTDVLAEVVSNESTDIQQVLKPLLAQKKQNVHLSAQFKRADNSLYEADVALYLSSAFDPPELIAIVQDITEKNRLLESIHRHQRMESIGNLTGGIAHDFNNILTVISGNLELLLDDVQNNPESLELVTDASEAAEMGARLTKRLLAFARRSSLTPNRANVNTLISDLSEMLSRTLGSSIALENRLAVQLWDTRIDISELENALVNLVINARDAMPDGGRLVMETQNCFLDDELILGKGVAPGEYVKISVSDTGEGIPAEITNSIFEPFVTSKKDGKGSGMGLSMVYGFVTQSGGCISVYSEPGQGSMFALYLPRYHESGKANIVGTESDETPNASQVPALSGKTILVVEDDDRVRKVVIKRLTRLGHAIIEAADGYAALELFKQHEDIDLVFSDITMTEGMTGYDLAIAVREMRPAVPVLLTSGYAEDIINAEPLQASGLELLRKPYDQKTLESYLDNMLEQTG